MPSILKADELNNYTVPELLTLAALIDAQVADRRRNAQRALIEKFQAEAEAEGLDFDELVGRPRKGRRPRTGNGAKHHTAT